MTAMLDVVYELPSLHRAVEKMSQRELAVYLTRILRSTMRGSHGYKLKKRPKWWPEDVTWCSPRTRGGPEWTRDLRRVVECCYKYYGFQEKLKGSPDAASPVKVNGVYYEYRSCQGSPPIPISSPESPDDAAAAAATDAGDAGRPRPQSLSSAFLPSMSPVCERFEPLCAKHVHSGMEGRQKIYATSFVELFVCRFCEKQFGGRNQLRVHQGSCLLKPPTHKGDTPVRSRWARTKPTLPSPVPRPRWCTQPVHPDNHERAPIARFAPSLELMQKSELGTMTTKTEKAIDFEHLDLDVEEEHVPRSPTTPKTKHLLLRPDMSPTHFGPKRSLSRTFSSSYTPKPEKPRTPKEESDNKEGREQSEGDVGDGDATSECSEAKNLEDGEKEGDAQSESSEGKSSDESDKDGVNLQRSAATRLLLIPITSELGQKLRKHIETKDDLVKKPTTDDEGAKDGIKIRNFEKYCHTPLQTDNQNRLRTRVPIDWPISFNVKRRVSDFRAHKYKFTGRDHVEFWKTVKTGLNSRARRLLSRMKPCEVRLRKLEGKNLRFWIIERKQPKVVLSRMTEKEIKRWTTKSASCMIGNRVLPLMVDPAHLNTLELACDFDLALFKHEFPVDAHAENRVLPQQYMELLRALNKSTTPVQDRKPEPCNAALRILNCGNKADCALTPPYTPQQQLSPASTCSEPPAASQPSTPGGASGGGRKRRLSEPSTPCKGSTSEDALRVEPMLNLEPLVFYTGGGRTNIHERARHSSGKVKKWDASGGVLVPLLGDPVFNPVAGGSQDDFVVTLNTSGESTSSARAGSKKIVMFGSSAHNSPQVPGPAVPSVSSGSTTSLQTAASDGSLQLNTKRKRRKKGKLRQMVSVRRGQKAAHGRKKTEQSPPSSAQYVAKSKTSNAKKEPQKPAKKRGRPRKDAAPPIDGRLLKSVNTVKLNLKKKRARGKGALQNGRLPGESSEGVLSNAVLSNASSSPQKQKPKQAQNQKPSAKQFNHRGMKRKQAARCPAVPTKKPKTGSLPKSSGSPPGSSGSAVAPTEKRPRSGSMIMFQCHMCGTQLRAVVGERDFIGEHYLDAHGVDNIRLKENVNENGIRTLSIIQDIPKNAPVPSSARAYSRKWKELQVQRTGDSSATQAKKRRRGRPRKRRPDYLWKTLPKTTKTTSPVQETKQPLADSVLDSNSPEN